MYLIPSGQEQYDDCSASAGMIKCVQYEQSYSKRLQAILWLVDINKLDLKRDRGYVFAQAVEEYIEKVLTN